MRLRIVDCICFLLAACTPVTTRPDFLPDPQAARLVLDAPPGRVTPEIATLVAAESLQVERVNVRDGYVETAWYDTRPRRHGKDSLLGRSLRAGTDAAYRGDRLTAALRPVPHRARSRVSRAEDPRGARDRRFSRRGAQEALWDTQLLTHRSMTSRSTMASLHGPLGRRIVSPRTGSLPATSRRPVVMSRSHATATTARGRRSRITRRASCPRVATNTGTS